MTHIKNFFAKLKGYRTQIFGTLAAIFGVLQMYSEIAPKEYEALYMVFVGVMIVILREITNTAPRKNQ